MPSPDPKWEKLILACGHSVEKEKTFFNSGYARCPYGHGSQKVKQRKPSSKSTREPSKRSEKAGHTHRYNVPLPRKDVRINRTTVMRTFECGERGCGETRRRMVTDVQKGK